MKIQFGRFRPSVAVVAAVASVLSVLVADAAAPVGIESAGFRQSLRLPDHADVSGVTWKGDSSFYVIRDGGNTSSNCCSVHEMTVALDGNGRMYSSPRMSPGVLLEGACDAEGIAYDPGSGNVWVADECGARISEYRPGDGRPTGRTVPVPQFVSAGVRGNLSLESLTISGDGTTMWTANEESLLGDGDTSRGGKGAVVRLMRFDRPRPDGDWEPSGMWAYRCDPVGSREPVCSGVSDLCALPDGSLLVLERECSYTTLGRTRIYRPDFSGATDVGGLEALTNRAFTAVAKGAPLYEVFDGRGSGDGFLKSQVACYEGLCLGPRNEDGSVNLMLVSDGGAASSRRKLFMTVSVETKPFVRALRMTGLDVRTLAFEPAESGTAGRVGSCYRYLSGSTVSVGLKQSRLARTGSAWTLPGHGLSGEGTNVTFVVTCDDRLHWQSPDALAFTRGRLEGRRPEELARAVAAPERRWQLGAGGFGRGRVRVERDAFRSGRTTVFGPEADLQYGLARHGPYDFRLGLGGAYCPRQGESLRREGPDAARAKTALGYGELRLLAVPQRQVTEDLMLGLRLGVALDWLSAESSAVGGGSDSDTRFAAQGILGVQATWLFTDRLGLYSNLDWRLGGEDEFEARDGESTVDLSGWYWSVGAFVTF